MKKSDQVIICSAGLAVTLPDPWYMPANRKITIINNSGSDVTVDNASTGGMSGGALTTIPPYMTGQYVTDGSSLWFADQLLGGADGADGVGVPTGGATGTFLKKSSGTDFDDDWAAITDADVAPVAPDAKTTDFTFVLADMFRIKKITDASASVATIPANASVAYPVGATLTIANAGTGDCTWTPDSGVTLRAPHGAKTNGQYSLSYATQIATDEWWVGGDVKS